VAIALVEAYGLSQFTRWLHLSARDLNLTLADPSMLATSSCDSYRSADHLLRYPLGRGYDLWLGLATTPKRSGMSA